MAESILSDVTTRIIELLATEAIKEIRALRDVKGDLEDLEKTLSTVKALLRDAERRQVSEEGVRIWLERLEDVVCDADYLLDQVSYEALQTSNSRHGRKVCSISFFSCPKRVAYRHKVAEKIKHIRKTLARIDADKNQFNFNPNSSGSSSSSSSSSMHDRETHSYVCEGNVIGREKEKQDILDLLSVASEGQVESFSVIPIVGIGGIGKTTLAQLIYNDPVVQQHFDLRLWVCVSEDFNIKSLLEKIMGSSKCHGDGHLDQLQRDLREKLHGKRYLLVLDDVWEEDRMKWTDFEALLGNNGSRGNRVLVTTRSDIVAEITGTVAEPYRLKELVEDRCWDLFRKMAFVRGKEPEDDPIKVRIGREIVRKCKGVPLVIKSIGSMLVSNPEMDWSSVNEELSTRMPDLDNKVLPALKLSYDHLPSDLKPCFAFCSLFPKDYEIDKEMLIDHWISQGFISISPSSQQSIEQVALQCFDHLVSRCFLEYDRGYHGQYKMHDLYHDLAVWVAGKKYATLSVGKSSEIDERTRHVSLLDFDNRSSSWKSQMPSSLVKPKCIKSILIPTESNFTIINRSFDPEFYETIVSKFKFLRSLDLHNSGIIIVPDSIGELKHLRSLDLSRNTKLKELPNSMVKLLFLQSLNLTSCFHLEKLPSGVPRLVSLRNLRLDYCHCLTHLPRGLGQLTNLQTLSRLVLSEDGVDSAELADLRNLNKLRGGLEIHNVKHGMDTEVADFGAKPYLVSLTLYWDSATVGVSSLEVVEHERTLRGIQSIVLRLEDLLLKGYGGVGFPSWLLFTNLVTLKLETMPALEYVMTWRDSSSATFFMPHLRNLRLSHLPNLKQWWRDHGDGSTSLGATTQLPCFGRRVNRICITHCPNLTCIPRFPFLSWDLELNNTSWEPFIETLIMTNVPEEKTQAIHNEAPSSSSSSSSSFIPLSELRHLYLSGNKGVECLPDCMQNLTNLSILSIEKFPKLKSLSPAIQFFASLTYMRICYCELLDMSDANVWRALRSLDHLCIRGLPQLVQLPQELLSVTTLQYLRIGFCYNLTSIPEWILEFKSLINIEIMECPELTSLPHHGLRPEIIFHEEENIYNFPYLKPRFNIGSEEEGYHCIPIPILRLHVEPSWKLHQSQNSSTPSPGLEWEPAGAFWVPCLVTNQQRH